MSNKDLGSGVTFLDPEGKGFESVVYREDKPHSHSEANLAQDLYNESKASALKGLMPSGFLTGDFLDDGYNDFVFSTNANEFEFNGRPIVHVNGWVFPVEYTATTSTGENVITLDAPDGTAGSIAVDFVFLEVWRALIDPEPSTTNKPASDKIYPNGNILSPAGVWLDDDLLDTPVAIANPGLETTRRVQIQYAIRSIRLIDPSKRLGYDDTEVEAQGPNASKVSGATFTLSATDHGLYVAGDEAGQPNAIPGTVDGYVYSIPIALVYRRNSSAFDFLANGNGGITGVGTATPSDRPDGLYSDQIVLEDVQDMRHAVGTEKPDWGRILRKNLSLLLDNELKTWVGQSAFTEFYVGGNNESFGNLYLKADDYLPSTSPDKPSGNTVRNPDGICTKITDRAHAEHHVVEYDAATYSGGGTWVSGDTLTLDFVSTNIEDEQPAGTVISDVLSVRLNDLAGGTGAPHMDIQSITGLGTGVVTITLDTPPVAGSAADIWVEYEVSYPSGSGLTSLVKEEAGNFNIVVHNPSGFNPFFSATFTDDAAGRAAILPYLTVSYEEGPHREVTVMYRPDTTRSVSTYTTATDEILLPEPAYVNDPLNPNPDFTVTVGGNPKTVTAISDDRRTITFNPPEVGAGVTATVDYTPHRPFPITSVESTLYYKAPAIQAIPFEYLDNPSDPVNLSLEVEPVYILDKVYSGTASSGSVITPFPYESPLNQIPVCATAGTAFQKEAELNAPGPISIDDFDANVGLLELPALVPMAFVDSVTLYDPVDVIGSQSLEFVDHYTAVMPDAYVPTAIAQSLSDPVEHKAFFAFIGRLKRDTDFARAETPVLVVVSQYYDYTSLLPSGTTVEQNRVTFAPDLSAASVYKIKGNFLSRLD